MFRGFFFPGRKSERRRLERKTSMLVRRLSLSLLSSSSLLLLCLISSYLLDRVSAVTADEPGHRDLIVSVRSSRREIGKKKISVSKKSGVVEKKSKKWLSLGTSFFSSLAAPTEKEKKKQPASRSFHAPKKASQREKAKPTQPWCSSPTSSGLSARTSCS